MAALFNNNLKEKEMNILSSTEVFTVINSELRRVVIKSATIHKDDNGDNKVIYTAEVDNRLISLDPEEVKFYEREEEFKSGSQCKTFDLAEKELTKSFWQFKNGEPMEVEVSTYILTPKLSGVRTSLRPEFGSKFTVENGWFETRDICIEFNDYNVEVDGEIIERKSILKRIQPTEEQLKLIDKYFAISKEMEDAGLRLIHETGDCNDLFINTKDVDVELDWDCNDKEEYEVLPYHYIKKRAIRFASYDRYSECELYAKLKD